MDTSASYQWKDISAGRSVSYKISHIANFLVDDMTWSWTSRSYIAARSVSTVKSVQRNQMLLVGLPIMFFGTLVEGLKVAKGVVVYCALSAKQIL